MGLGPLTGVSGGATHTYVYDGDGNLVKATVSGVTTAFIGNYCEYSAGALRKHYYAGGTRIGTRVDSNPINWLLTDHLGSTAVTTNSSGTATAELRYKAYGTTRYAGGTQQTNYRFTGQRIEPALDLYFYASRWYDPVVGRFLQPDSVVPQPGNPQSPNRYAYTLNNPVRYTDPTGHWVFEQTPEDPFYIPYYQSPTGSSMRVESDPCLGACTGPAPIDPLSQAIGEAAVGMLWEPADWAITIAHWASGDFHPLDLVGLLPLVPASVTRVARNLDEVADVARAVERWQVGGAIDAATRNGYPSWSTVRSRYWRNAAQTAASSGKYTADNLARMRAGRPPLHQALQVPMELHHIRGQNIPDPHNPRNLQELWPWQHADIDPQRFYTGPRPSGP